MTGEMIAQKHAESEARWMKAERVKAPNRLKLYEIHFAWCRALDHAVQLKWAIREAEDLERASGNPAEGAGSPDAAGEVGSGGVVTRRVKESEASTK